MNCRLIAILSVLLITFLYTSEVTAGELEESTRAHGGIEKFRGYGTLEYDFIWSTKMGEFKDHQLIDLKTRRVLITSDKYTVGFDGREAWIAPDAGDMPLPARFYSSTPFYFFGLPFLFLDPGANSESLGTQGLGGKAYDVLKITYDKGVGDTPDDNYMAYIDKETNRLKLVSYIVTYTPFMKGKNIEELERHAAAYDEWQDSGGLLVPEKITFYDWKDGNIDGEPRGVMTFQNVTFTKESPDPSVFAKPDGAETDDSLKAQ